MATSTSGEVYTGGAGGSPNGRTGGAAIISNWSSPRSVSGGTGFVLGINQADGSYGTGGGVSAPSDLGISVKLAGGGSGGYYTEYINVSAGQIITIVVGTCGTNTRPSNWSNDPESFTSPANGACMIAYGGDI